MKAINGGKQMFYAITSLGDGVYKFTNGDCKKLNPNYLLQPYWIFTRIKCTRMNKYTRIWMKKKMGFVSEKWFLT